MRRTVLILATLVTLQTLGGGFYSSTPVDVKGRTDPKPLDDAIPVAIEAVQKADARCKATSVYNSGEESPPEYGICVNPDGTMSQLFGGNDNFHVAVECQEGGVIVHTHGMQTWTCTNEETGESTQCYTALGPSPADVKNAIDGKYTVIAVDCASGLSIGVDKDGRSFQFANGKRDYSAIDISFEITIDGKVQVSRYSDRIAKKQLEKANRTSIENKRDLPLAQDGQPIDSKGNTPGVSLKDALHSLADLLETGEEIVEVREDMREERRERKAREQAERERKAAEEERLLQQQLDAQRRKAQSDQKKSKSSGAEVARRPTPTTQQNRPAGTKPATETGTEPTDTGSQTSTTPPAQTTVRIDFTPLDNCTSILNSSRNLIGSLAASMVEVAMSDGEKAYSKLKSQIASLPDGDRKQQLEQTLEAKYAAFKAAKSYYE